MRTANQERAKQFQLTSIKNNLVLLAYSAGPVMANSPTVLTPPIPRWGPSVARGGRPFTTPPAAISLPCLEIIFGLGAKRKEGESRL